MSWWGRFNDHVRRVDVEGRRHTLALTCRSEECDALIFLGRAMVGSDDAYCPRHAAARRRVRKINARPRESLAVYKAKGLHKHMESLRERI